MRGREGPVIPVDAHVRVVHPTAHDGARMLRRGYSFVDGSDAVGGLDAGLFFLAYVRDPRTQFIPLQNQMAKADALMEYLRFTSSTRDPGIRPAAPRREPRAHRETPQVTLSFSELKYLFECPYQFKLRFLYGFNPPIHEALGYGKGLHDALAEVHKRAIHGDVVGVDAAVELVERHLHTPYAYPDLRETLRRAAVDAVRRYLGAHEEDLSRTVHSEKQIQVHVAPGIVVDGRIDLIRRLQTDELAIVDFKSSERAQAEHVTRDQLHVYAVGYEELSGERADLIEVLNLDERGRSTREEVDQPLLTSVRGRIREAGQALRDNKLPRYEEWCDHCATCDLATLCREVPRS